VIREMTLEDVPHVAPLLYRFHAETTYCACPATPVEVLIPVLKSMVNNPEYCMLVAHDGATLQGLCCGALAPAHPFLPHTPAVHEFAWWVALEHRGSLGGRLLAALKAWAKTHGAEMLSYGKPCTSYELKPGLWAETTVRMAV
jgi:acetyltransferase (GNAT) family protein